MRAPRSGADKRKRMIKRGKMHFMRLAVYLTRGTMRDIRVNAHMESPSLLSLSFCRFRISVFVFYFLSSSLFFFTSLQRTKWFPFVAGVN